MEKKRFDFYQDVKVTVWQRQHFVIEADTIEEAREQAKKYADQDISFSEDVEVEDLEWLCETEKYITPEENGGCATIEVYEYVSKSDGNLITNNAVSKELSAVSSEEEPRKLIGCQIAFKDGKWPEGLFSFQVFRTEEDARVWMEENEEEGCIVPIYEGDVEEPVFIGRNPRIFEKNEEVCVVDGLDGFVKAIVEIRTSVEYENDLVGVYPIVNGFCDHKNRFAVAADSVYRRAGGKMCLRCGNPLYVEHHDEIDYPYYCPVCQENFYNFEVK